jgi:hypothetical protein
VSLKTRIQVVSFFLQQLSSDMPGACSQVLDAGNNLLKAAQQLRIDPLNGSIRSILVDSAKKVLEYTVNVSKSFCSAIYSQNSLERKFLEESNP